MTILDFFRDHWQGLAIAGVIIITLGLISASYDWDDPHQ